MKKPALTRYEFLALASKSLLGICGALGLAGLARFLDYEPEPPLPSRFEIGEVSNYPVNSRTVLADIPAIVIHTRDGFSAYSLICTHLGCTVEAKGNTFSCPCHGSRYDSAGEVTKGPAVQHLQVLRVEVTVDNQLIIYRS